MLTALHWCLTLAGGWQVIAWVAGAWRRLNAAIDRDIEEHVRAALGERR